MKRSLVSDTQIYTYISLWKNIITKPKVVSRHYAIEMDASVTQWAVEPIRIDIISVLHLLCQG